VNIKKEIKEKKDILLKYNENRKRLKDTATSLLSLSVNDRTNNGEDKTGRSSYRDNQSYHSLKE